MKIVMQTGYELVIGYFVSLCQKLVYNKPATSKTSNLTIMIAHVSNLLKRINS